MNIKDFQVRKVLYLSLVRGLFAYASQVWSPQTVSNIVKIEKVQRRATKFILSLPYKTDISYKERLQTIRILPVCYWQEYLDMVYIYKCLVYKSDENISIKRRGRVTRMNDITNGILLEIPRSRTVAYKNSFYVRAPSVWNTLPKDLRDTTRSVSSFKTNLCQFYNKLLDDIVAFYPIFFHNSLTRLSTTTTTTLYSLQNALLIYITHTLIIHSNTHCTHLNYTFQYTLHTY